MALKWLGGGKPDHPLADDKGAKEVLSALPSNDAAKAIQDIRDWIESVLGTGGFKGERRGEVIMLLDEAAQIHQRKLARDYLANPRLPKFQEARLWGALFGLWKDLAGAYVACAAQFTVKAQLPLFCLRAVRAVAAQLKLQQAEELFSKTFKALSTPIVISRLADGVIVEVNEAWERDNGAGFEPRRAQQLFGVFERLHTEAEFERTGVGLAIVKRIIERHGGAIRAEAAPGQGATFCFRLPR